jgi:hypothetical protein
MDVARVMRSAHDTTERLKVDFEAGCRTLRVNQTQLRDTINTTRMESQQIRTDFQRLRDDLMPWVMGRTMTGSPLPGLRTLVHSEAESSKLRFELERALIESPSDLKEACENTIHALNFPYERIHRHPLQTHHNCACLSAFKRTMIRSGRFSFFFETRTEHDYTCGCQFKNRKLWSYMLACQLLPLLQKTLTFTMTWTSGAGGNSIGVHLNFYRIVKRVDSELFKLFDSFPGRLRKTRCGTMLETMQEDQICFGKSGGWDLFKIELSVGDIDGLARSFTELLRLGHGWDKDEYGNTVLHVCVPFVLVAATNMSN